ncbi:TetR/AcrR family transcriptional regulator [Lipingzhangella sp. LS1_29]|uniref:TetR/AcrR family transcriptional regulator n=1 Tax=Lipingzhangella rawalii TaxID=2055835 RepID=A0ABU2H1B4_9ACTN|nr:TetR/AcrR family transcriptional regulator [Lipingzhangella rawalii]MDS1269084.1 TetR/AcrR family transcriptional regulator [Lipingzhangella rawalii]
MTHPNNRNPPSTTAGAPRGRPAGDHTAKRVELLRAATSVIAENGYANASLRAVAQKAGCTTGAVTYYFASRQELVIAVAEHHFDSFDAMLADVRDQTDIRTLVERWLSHTTDDPEFWPVMSQLLVHARYAPTLARVIERRYTHFRTVYTELLATGQEQGTVRDDIPADLLADQLAAMGDGWMIMAPFEPARFSPSRIRALVEAALTLITPPPCPAHGPQP